MKRLVALVLVSSTSFLSTRAAQADEDYIYARGRAQGGLIVENRPQQDALTDLHLDGIPEVGFTHDTPTSDLTLNYTLTATLHSEYSSGLGHRLTLAESVDLSPRTSLAVSAYAARTTLSNILLTQPASAGAAGLFPAASTTFVNVGANQGLFHELSPRVRLDQEASTAAYKTLFPAVPTSSSYFSLGGGLERVWQNDGLGGSLLANYAHSKPDPTFAPEQDLVVLSGGPRWRHDWSRYVNTLVDVGAAMVESLSSSSQSYFTPSARGSLLYATEEVRATFVASTGVTPNTLTGQLVQAHAATINAAVPLSLSAGVFLDGSLGYTHGKLIDRREPTRNLSYDSALADVGLVWELAPFVEAYARYTFVVQGGAAATGGDLSFTRSSVLIGLQLSTRPLVTRGGVRASGQPNAAQRVDRADEPTREPAEPSTDAPTRAAD